MMQVLVYYICTDTTMSHDVCLVSMRHFKTLRLVNFARLLDMYATSVSAEMCATRVLVQQQWNSNSWLNVVYEFRSANSNNSASRPKLLKRMLFDVVLQISTQGLRLLGTATPPCFGSCGAWSVRVVSYWSLTLGRFLKEWICHVEKFVTHNISWIFDMIWHWCVTMLVAFFRVHFQTVNSYLRLLLILVSKFSFLTLLLLELFKSSRLEVVEGMGKEGSHARFHLFLFMIFGFGIFCEV